MKMATAVLEEVVHQTTTKSVGELKRLLEELDLGCIKFKLMDSDEGPGWSREKADEIEVEYKRFLYLCVTTGRSIIPTGDIDEFWHKHILDTQKYQEDCERVFGFFLHHFPYIGMRGPEDAENLKSLFAETKDIYQEAFGESYGLGADAQDCENCGQCGASCGVGGKASDCQNCGTCGSTCGVGGGRTRPTVEPTISARPVFV